VPRDLERKRETLEKREIENDMGKGMARIYWKRGKPVFP